MDLFATMTTFVQVVKQSSFTTAARALGISRALVSRHITDLETHLGTRLLVRTTRSVSLTEAGHSYYELSSRILSEVANAEQEISGRMQEAVGTLSVIVPKWIGSLDVAEAVTAFCVEYPKLKVDLVLGGMSQKTYDFLDRGFDVALQTREIANSLVKVKRVATIRYVLVATPGCLEANGAPAGLQDLRHIPCVIQVDDPVWVLTDGNGLQRVKVNAHFASNAYTVLRMAVKAGLGIGLLPHHLVEEDLRNGSLEVVLPEIAIPDRPLYAAFAPGGTPPAKVRLFTNFLTAWFKRNPLA